MVAAHGQSARAQTLAGKNGQRIACSGGEAAGFGCREVDLLSRLTPAELGATMACNGGKSLCGVNDMWGWFDLQTGKEYAIVGREDGTAFVDVTDPVNPLYVGNLAHNGAAPSVWRDIKVYADYAYIVADGFAGNGVQIFDLTQLRGLSGAPVEFEMTGLYTGISMAHNIVINEASGFAYVVGYRENTMADNCGRGLHIIDLADPADPVYAGCFAFPATGRSNDGYTHDAQCVNYHGPDPDYQGREICFGMNVTHITVADVTDKSNPIAIAKADYPAVHYVHQGWLSEDHRYLFQGDELDEFFGDTEFTRTLVWDIIDLDDPVLFDEYEAPGRSIDHNLYIKDGFMYQTNYIDGLRILDVSDPSLIFEVAHFDTFKEDPVNPSVWSGTWSNYPFFKSGAVGLSSRREGLFMVQPTMSAPVAVEEPETPEDFVVFSAYPNPFASRFTISLSVPITQNINVTLYNVLGREIQSLYSGTVLAGREERINVELIGYPAGTYFYQITGEDFMLSKPIVLAR